MTEGKLSEWFDNPMIELSHSYNLCSRTGFIIVLNVAILSHNIGLKKENNVNNAQHKNKILFITFKIGRK